MGLGKRGEELLEGLLGLQEVAAGRAAQEVFVPGEFGPALGEGAPAQGGLEALAEAIAGALHATSSTRYARRAARRFSRARCTRDLIAFSLESMTRAISA